MVKYPWLLVFVLCVASFLGAFDVTALNLALVWIQKDLSLSLSGIDWVFNSYNIAFATLIVPAGRFSDIFGNRIFFLWGILIFTVASFCIGLSSIAWQLILLRSLQGVGAAMFFPTVQTSIYAMGNKKHIYRTTGLSITSASLGLACGPWLSGYIIGFLSWRWIFYINVPICLLCFLIAFFTFPKNEKRNAKKKIDFMAILFLVCFCFSLMHAIDLGGIIGLSNKITLGWFAASLGLLWLLVVREDNVADPLFNFKKLYHKTFILGVFFRMIASFTFFSILFLLGYALQHFLMIPPIQTGYYFLPFTLSMAIASLISGFLLSHFKPSTIMIISLALFGIGTIVFASITRISMSYLYISMPLIFCGFSFGLMLPTNNLYVLEDLEKEYRGIGNGIRYGLILVSASIAVLIASIFMRTPGVKLALQLMHESNIPLNEMKISLVHMVLKGMITIPDALAQFSNSSREAYFAIKEGFLHAMRIDLYFCSALLLTTCLIYILYRRAKRKNQSL